MFFDPMYFILVAPGLLLMLWAQSRVKSTYRKWGQVRNMRGLTGAQAARMVLDNSGLQEVPIEAVAGDLTDHYDPRKRVLRLSQGVYGVPSVAAVAVATIIVALPQFSYLVFGVSDERGLTLLLAASLVAVILHHFLEALFAALRKFRIVSTMRPNIKELTVVSHIHIASWSLGSNPLRRASTSRTSFSSAQSMSRIFPVLAASCRGRSATTHSCGATMMLDTWSDTSASGIGKSRAIVANGMNTLSLSGPE